MAIVAASPDPDLLRRVAGLQVLTIAWMTVEALKLPWRLRRLGRRVAQLYWGLAGQPDRIVLRDHRPLAISTQRRFGPS